jgi:hypothetical protein
MPGLVLRMFLILRRRINVVRQDDETVVVRFVGIKEGIVFVHAVCVFLFDRETNMICKKIGMAGLVGASLLSGGFAYADEESAQTKDWHVTVSAKGWYESWSTWQTVTSGVGTLINASDSKVDFIGGVTARYKDFFLSGNYSPKQTFTFSDVGLQHKRSEGDINFGYYVHPQVGLSVGYKQVKLEYNPNAVWTYDFLTVGINGSARIEGTPFFLYGNGAGSLTGTSSVSFTTVPRGTPKYASMETGLGWSATQSLIVTFGYKFQQIELPLNFVGGTTENTRDTTTGYILGVAYTF